MWANFNMYEQEFICILITWKECNYTVIPFFFIVNYYTFPAFFFERKFTGGYKGFLIRSVKKNGKHIQKQIFL